MMLLLKKTSAGLEKPPSARLNLRPGILLPGLEVGEIGLAERAGDGLQVELDVILEAGFEGLEEVGTELLAGRATQPLPPPDGPDCVFAAVALLEHHRELAAEAVGITEGLLDASRLGVGEGIIGVGAEVLAGDLGHGAILTFSPCICPKQQRELAFRARRSQVNPAFSAAASYP
jgi:hypothetical protein